MAQFWVKMAHFQNYSKNAPLLFLYIFITPGKKKIWPKWPILQIFSNDAPLPFLYIFITPGQQNNFGPKWPILQNCSKHVPLRFYTFSKPQGTKTFWVKMAHFTELLLRCSLAVFIHFHNPRLTKKFGPKWPILQNFSNDAPFLFLYIFITPGYQNILGQNGPF